MASRPRGYGLAADEKRKIDSKYSIEEENNARQWIEAVIQEPLVPGASASPLGPEAFGQALKDGTFLCKLLHKLDPSFRLPKAGTTSFQQAVICRSHGGLSTNEKKEQKIFQHVTRLWQSVITWYAYDMMEAIEKFLKGCQSYGLMATDTFQVVDLYEAQNLNAVVCTITALGRKAQTKGFDGPVLGPKESTENVRDFTEEQLREGEKIIGLQMGTNKHANQSGMIMGKNRQIID